MKRIAAAVRNLFVVASILMDMHRDALSEAETKAIEQGQPWRSR